MKQLLIFYSIAFFSLLVACGEKKETTANGDATGPYACPMRCEGDKVYAEPGQCPVCGMDLQPMRDVGASPGYEMKLTTVPDMPEAGKETQLVFMPKQRDNESAQVPLDEVHEKKIHVIIVSSDLAWYDHIHPEYQADGSYTVKETFPYGGDYIVFADYQPTGAGNMVDRLTLVVSGNKKQPETFTTEIMTSQTDGYEVTLQPLQGKFLTNNVIHLGVDITEGGKAVTDLESVMGAKGHLVIISGDGQKYLHVHPDEIDGKLHLHTQFDQAGFYRAFFQFQTNGKLHTSYFTIEVKEGKPGELGTPDHHGGEVDDHHHDNGSDHTH